MPPEERYEVHIVGFANDVARARVLEQLGLLGNLQREPECFVVASCRSRDEAEQEQQRWRRLGAHVRIVAPASPSPAEPLGKETPPRSLARATLRALAIGSLAGVAAWWLGERAMPRGVWKLPGKVDASGSLSHRASPDKTSDPPVWATTIPNDIHSDEAARLNNEGVAAAERKEWMAAAKHLRAALRLAPAATGIQRNLQQVLLGWGVDALRSGDVGTAVDRLEEARRLGPDAQVFLWLGYAFQQQGDLGKAQAAWEAGLEQFPEQPDLLLALGELWEQRDQREKALDYFSRARAAGIDGPELQRKMERLGRELDAEWEYLLTRSARFDVRHPESEPSRTIEFVLANFEAAYDHLLQLLGVGPTPPISVVLYPKEQFHAVTQSPDWAGGVFSGRIQLPVGGLNEGNRLQLQRVARHELAHALVSEWSRRRAPAWLQEGMAMWCEDDHPGERSDWALSRRSADPSIRLADLPASFALLGPVEAEAAYASSYLAVLHLAEHYGPRKLLELLRASAQQDFSTAFRETFGQDLKDFAEAF